MIWGSRSQLARCEFHCHRLRPRCRCETFWGGTGAVLDTHAVQVPSGKRTKKRTGKSPSLIFKFGKSTTNEVFSIVLLNYQRVPGRLGSCAHCDLGLLTNRVLRGSTPKDYLDAIGRSSSRPIFCRFHVVFFWWVYQRNAGKELYLYLYIYIWDIHTSRSQKETCSKPKKCRLMIESTIYCVFATLMFDILMVGIPPWCPGSWCPQGMFKGLCDHVSHFFENPASFWDELDKTNSREWEREKNK